MTTQTFDFDKNPDFVAEYDRGPPMFIPGYAASHIIAATVLTSRIGASGDILVIGAGGGVEIAAFAAITPGWRYTGVDPSRAMLDLARTRLTRERSEVNVALHQGVAADAPPGPYDAATALLCLMFAPDDGSRLDQLKAVRERLKPGSPFLMIHPAVGGADRQAAIDRYAQHARLMGAEEELIARAVAMQEDQVHVLSPDREEQLLRDAGFTIDGIFFRGLWVHGWEATA